MGQRGNRAGGVPGCCCSGDSDACPEGVSFGGQEGKLDVSSIGKVGQELDGAVGEIEVHGVLAFLSNCELTAA